eukprot:708033-Amphidinium_carterae.1
MRMRLPHKIASDWRWTRHMSHRRGTMDRAGGARRLHCRGQPLPCVVAAARSGGSRWDGRVSICDPFHDFVHIMIVVRLGKHTAVPQNKTQKKLPFINLGLGSKWQEIASRSGNDGLAKTSDIGMGDLGAVFSLEK